MNKFELHWHINAIILHHGRLGWSCNLSQSILNYSDSELQRSLVWLYIACFPSPYHQKKPSFLLSVLFFRIFLDSKKRGGGDDFGTNTQNIHFCGFFPPSFILSILFSLNLLLETGETHEEVLWRSDLQSITGYRWSIPRSQKYDIFSHSYHT